jgi:hypothetical protein
VAVRQASYDGALGARAIYSLQLYGQNELAYENNAFTVTAIYHDGTLKMYTSHLAQPNGPGSRPEYYMTQINTWGMTGNEKTFRQGATAFRNARDWAKEQRDEAIRRANERADDRRSTTPGGPISSSSFITEVSILIATASFGLTPESQSQKSLTTQIDGSSTSETAH